MCVCTFNTATVTDFYRAKGNQAAVAELTKN